MHIVEVSILWCGFLPLQSRQTESCCVGFVSRTDAEAWAQVAEEEGCKLGQNYFGDAYFLRFRSYGVVSSFIIPTSPTTLDSESHNN